MKLEGELQVGINNLLIITKRELYSLSLVIECKKGYKKIVWNN